jgi:AraC family transcriptional regulator
MRVAYLRYVGPYAGDGKLFENLYKRLFAWTGPRDIDVSTTYIIYHDDPNVTDEDKLRMSICVPVGSDVQVSGEIGEMTINGGTYAVGTFLLGNDEYAKAWDYMYSEWLPGSGYQPAPEASFERYSSHCEADGKMMVDICVPVTVM